jgi:hypothetical protein
MSTPITQFSAATSSGSDIVRFVPTARKLIFSRPAAIIWVTGLAALVAGFRLATHGGTEGEEMFRSWMMSWAVIWFALAGVGLRLVKPLYDFFVTDQITQLEAYQVKQLRRLQPGFDQELRSLALYQQPCDERAADATTKPMIDAGAIVRGANLPQCSEAKSKLSLDARLTPII